MNTKSATTAGLLGIFLGAFGAHNWYLGEKGKGIAHVCMMCGGILVQIIAALVIPNVLSFSALLAWASILGILTGIASLAMAASGIWGLVEGIIILTQGDAGLAAKGYAVNAPVNQYNNYNQPGYGPQGNYGQPNYGPMPNQGYNSQPNYGPMSNQGYNGQPMNQQVNNFPQSNSMPNMNNQNEETQSEQQ